MCGLRSIVGGQIGRYKVHQEALFPFLIISKMRSKVSCAAAAAKPFSFLIDSHRY